jgi:hypothetical protein
MAMSLSWTQTLLAAATEWIRRLRFAVDCQMEVDKQLARCVADEAAREAKRDSSGL